jgi:[ribosomal protein S5]-alanine N-acetyltransferase
MTASGPDTPSPPMPGWSVAAVGLADAEDWTAYAVLPEVMRHTSSSVRGVADVLAIIQRTLSGEPGAPAHFTLRTPAGRLAGTVGFHTISPLNRTAEVTYDVHPGFWGQGLATAACAEAVRWGFEQRGWLRIQATTLEPHLASQRVLAKCGFAYEGRLRHYRLVRGEPRDYLLFARLAGDP